MIKTTIKIILGIVILLTQLACKSNEIGIYTIYNGLDRHSFFTKGYYNYPPTYLCMKYTYLVDTLRLSSSNLILKSNQTDNYYILPERLVKDEKLCEDLLVQNTECFLMCRALSKMKTSFYDENWVRIDYYNSDEWERIYVDECVKKALVNDSIHTVDGFQCKRLDPWPDKFLIFFVKGFIYNDIIHDIKIEGDNYKELEFPNPYGYYQVAVPVWLKEESK